MLSVSPETGNSDDHVTASARVGRDGECSPAVAQGSRVEHIQDAHQWLRGKHLPRHVTARVHHQVNASSLRRTSTVKLRNNIAVPIEAEQDDTQAGI